MKEKIENLIALAKELGIEKEVREVIDNKFSADFDMTDYGMEYYFNSALKPIGVVIDDKLVVSLYDAPSSVKPDEAKEYCRSIYLRGYICDVFPDDFDISTRLRQLNRALISIGGEVLQENSIRPVLLLK